MLHNQDISSVEAFHFHFFSREEEQKFASAPRCCFSSDRTAQRLSCRGRQAVPGQRGQAFTDAGFCSMGQQMYGGATETSTLLYDVLEKKGRGGRGPASSGRSITFPSDERKGAAQAR